MLNIVLFGPPGAGKGTQSQKLIDRYNLVHLSTGDLLRAEIAAGTKLGIAAKSIMDNGDLVSDEIVIGMIANKLDSSHDVNGFIFDGFPRTVAQAQALDELMNEKGTAITAMLSLEVDEDELTKRLLLRGQQSGRADDANEEVIKNRIKEYNNKTAPLKQYYQHKGKAHTVQGIGEVDTIFLMLTRIVNKIHTEEGITFRRPENEMAIGGGKSDFAGAFNFGTIEERPAPIEENRSVTIADIVASVNSKPERKIASKPKPTKTLIKPAKKENTTKTKKAKVVKKAVKKTAPKKAVKKVAKKATPKKVVKKVAPKKALKKAVKKAAPKKAIKKVVPKKAMKKAVKKATPKKAIKKIAPKKAPQKLVKKTTAKKGIKKAPQKAIKKKMANKKPIAKKTASKKVVKKKKR
jgi:adenylate kinase